MLVILMHNAFCALCEFLLHVILFYSLHFYFLRRVSRLKLEAFPWQPVASRSYGYAGMQADLQALTS